jgi:tetratricopeptide (TPR) repeat protein/uncharacterized caspase-like protein
MYCLKPVSAIKLLFSLAILLVLALNSQAQTKGGKVQNTVTQNAVKGESYAIIFGVSNYPGLTPLKYADKDATLFRDFLETSAGGNVKPENIFFRINEEAKGATFEVDACAWVNRKKLKEGDRLYVYFSGHGDAINEDNYFLLPYDCTPNNDVNNYLATGRIEMYHIKTVLIKPLIRQKVEVLLIVDACRTNDLPGGQQGQQNFVNDVQSIAEQKQGEIIMLSAGAGQAAIESPKVGNGHGLFTWYLIAGLSGDADKEGDAADHDGNVSLAEITSYVKNHVRKEAKTLFNANQVPVFLPPDKDLETIAVVDSGTYKNWKLAENMRQQTSGDNNMLAVVSKKAVKAGSVADTALINLDNKFIAAIKTSQLSGENSAEDFYNKMQAKWPGQSITEDAKYLLATEYINFGQEKINLFLSGKGIVHIQRMENEYKNKKKGTDNNGVAKNVPVEIEEQIDKMRTLTTTGFGKAADMMEKAVKLLGTDPELLESIYPKLYFLKAASYDQLNNVSKKRQAVVLLKKAISKDSTAAYNYLMLGHVLYGLNNDSCEMYFKKAIKLAPKWAEPENDIANFYSAKRNNKLAIMHYAAAIKLDSLDALAYQNIGVLYSNDKMIDSAKKYFLKGLSINPCDRYANSNMGSLHSSYMTHNSASDPNFRIAEKYIKKSIECDSTFTRAYLVLSGLFDKVNLRDSSIYYLNKGIAKNSDDAILYRFLAEQYFEMKDTLKAETIYKKALAVDSLDINNYLSLSWLYQSAGQNNSRVMPGKKNDFGKAIFYCQKAIKVDPTSAYSYSNLGDIYTNLEMYDNAIANFQKALKIDSTYVDALNDMGNAYYYKKDNATAVMYYQKAIKIDPKFAYGYNNLANTYFYQKDYDKALVNYQKTIEIDSTYVNAYRKLGNIYSINKIYNKSITNYKKAIKLDATNSFLYDELGNVYRGLKQYDTAIVYHQKAIQLSPFNAYHYSDLGFDYEASNKDDEAIRCYKKGIEIDSTNALPYLNLAYTYQKLKDYDKALINFQKVSHLKPNNAYVYNAIGSIYKELKDYPKQIYYYKKALDIDSTQTYRLQDLGLAYIYSKDYKNGIACLEKVLKLFPEDQASYYNLACGWSLANNNDTALKYLKGSLDKGFKDYSYLYQDADLENLRKQPEFTTLMKQYFPDKFK